MEVRLPSGMLQCMKVDPMTTLAQIKLELREFDPWWHRLSGLRYDALDDRVRVGSLTMTGHLSLAVVTRRRGGASNSAPRSEDDPADYGQPEEERTPSPQGTTIPNQPPIRSEDRKPEESGPVQPKQPPFPAGGLDAHPQVLRTVMGTEVEGVQRTTVQQSGEASTTSGKREQRDDDKPFDALYRDMKREREGEEKPSGREEPRQREEAPSAGSGQQARHGRSPSEADDAEHGAPTGRSGGPSLRRLREGKRAAKELLGTPQQGQTSGPSHKQVEDPGRSRKTRKAKRRERSPRGPSPQRRTTARRRSDGAGVSGATVKATRP